MKMIIRVFFLALFFITSGYLVWGLANPAAVYCNELGYHHKVVETAQGEKGVCVVSDYLEFDEWDFLRGRVGRDFSYCAKQGYETDVVNDSGKEYIACVVPEQKNSLRKSYKSSSSQNIPVVDMMNLRDKLGGEMKLAEREITQEEFETLTRELNLVTLYNISNFSTWDWRSPPNNTIYGTSNFTHFDGNNGWVTSVKDQALCGSCWAFSAVAGLESKYEINQNNSRLNPDLSEQYLISCDFTCDGGDCQTGCGGGYMDLALNYSKDYGISDETCFSYTDSNCETDGTGCTYLNGYNQSNSLCSNKCSDSSSRLWNISSFGGGWLGTSYFSLTINQTKQYLIDNGPMIAAMNANELAADGRLENCTSANDVSTNHGVLLVGYNDTGNIATSYWIIKNSWGTGSGDGGTGYFRLGFNECNFTSQFEYPTTVNPPNLKPKINLNYPVQDSNINTTEVTFNFTVINRVSSTSTCDLFINGTINQTNTSVYNNTNTYFIANLSLGDHYWNITCWETGLGIINISRANTFSIVNDATTPTVTLNSPANGFNISSTLNITFNCTASDNMNITNVTLYGNWSGGWHANQTNSSGIGNVSYLFMKNITDGDFRWNCYACDNSSNCAFASSNLSFRVDTLNPQISFSTGTENNVSYVSRNWVYSNVSLSESVKNITWDINGTKTTYNTTRYYHNQTSLGEGNFSYNVTACDYVGNCNSTETRLIILDMTLPYFSVLPTNSEVNYSQSFLYYVNATDSVLFANYSINDTTNFLVNSSGFIKNNTLLSVGKYSLNITINDSAGNRNSSIMTITVKLNVTSAVAANVSTNLDLSQASSNITLYLSQNANTTLVVTKETPSSKPSTSLNTLKGINVTSDNATNASLSWAYIKIYYNSTETTSASIDETTLKIYYYNDSAAAWQVESSTGVETTSDYVWANVTHFSLFGAFGSAPSTSSPGGSGGGGGGGSSTTKVISLTRSLVTYVDLGQSTNLIFSANNGQQHTLKLNNVYTDKVDFILSSEAVKFTLMIGEEKILNLSADDQLYVQLQSITSSKASITLKEIIKKALPVIILPKNEEKREREAKNITETKTDVLAKQTTTEKPETKPKSLVAGILILLAVAIIVILFLLFREKNNSEIDQIIKSSKIFHRFQTSGQETKVGFTSGKFLGLRENRSKPEGRASHLSRKGGGRFSLEKYKRKK